MPKYQILFIMKLILSYDAHLMPFLHRQLGRKGKVYHSQMARMPQLMRSAATMIFGLSKHHRMNPSSLLSFSCCSPCRISSSILFSRSSRSTQEGWPSPKCPWQLGKGSFSSFLRASQASMMSSQCFLAEGLMSGWYCRESSLKAFRISCLEAPGKRLRTSKGLCPFPPSCESRQHKSKARIITLMQIIFKFSNTPLQYQAIQPYSSPPFLQTLPIPLPYPFPRAHLNLSRVLRCILIMLTTQQQEKVLGALLQKKENALCADCNGKSPCWASLDFGVFVCMNCSGAHRFLGPTTTRVRSTKLDTWNRDWVENMRIGNTVLNEYWQHPNSAFLVDIVQRIGFF